MDFSNWRSYLFSLHYFPLSVSLVSSAGLYYCGWGPLYWGCTAALGVVVWRLVFFLEPLLTLSPCGGKFHVSTREVAAGDIEKGDVPLTIFYPTAVAPPPMGTPWLHFNDVRYLTGMARYAGIPSFLMRDLHLTRIATSTDSPCIPLKKEDGTMREIILFSHGLAGHPRLYSQLFLNLAARGAIVVAVTHTDASASFCRDASNTFHVDLNTKLRWVKEDREPQLIQRANHILRTIHKIRNGSVMSQLGLPEGDVRHFSQHPPPITLMGHSFGGSTVLLAALQACGDGPLAASKHHGIGSVVTFDPWFVPLYGKLFWEPIEQKRMRYVVPTLQFHSEAWVRTKESWEFFEKHLHHEVVNGQELHADEVNFVKEASRRSWMAGVASHRLQPDVKDVEDDGLNWYTVRATPATGHLSVTDMSILSPVVYRHGYMTSTPLSQLVEWTNSSLRFCAAHCSIAR